MKRDRLGGREPRGEPRSPFAAAVGGCSSIPPRIGAVEGGPDYRSAARASALSPTPAPARSACARRRARAPDRVHRVAGLCPHPGVVAEKGRGAEGQIAPRDRRIVGLLEGGAVVRAAVVAVGIRGHDAAEVGDRGTPGV